MFPRGEAFRIDFYDCEIAAAAVKVQQRVRHTPIYQRCEGDHHGPRRQGSRWQQTQCGPCVAGDDPGLDYGVENPVEMITAGPWRK
jgi:hypothetical protein